MDLDVLVCSKSYKDTSLKNIFCRSLAIAICQTQMMQPSELSKANRVHILFWALPILIMHISPEVNYPNPVNSRFSHFSIRKPQTSAISGTVLQKDHQQSIHPARKTVLLPFPVLTLLSCLNSGRRFLMLLLIDIFKYLDR